MSTSLDISDIVDISVYMEDLASTRKTFNLGMILGSTSTSEITTTERVRTYTRNSYKTSMVADGYTTSSPEYEAALLYFNSDSKPNRLAIGRRSVITVTCDTTLDSAVITPSAMSNLIVGQVVSGTGIPTGAVIISIQSTTVTLDHAATATGSAVSLTFTESYVSAFNACRNANLDWYAFHPCDAAKADIVVLAAEVESAAPCTAMFYTTSDSDILTNTAGNVFLTLKGLSYQRSVGQYSTTAYAAASIMGYSMGANKWTANSAYTLFAKSETGVAVENITETQKGYITAANGNVYVEFGSTYDWFINGVMADGTWYDTVVNIDKLVSDLQLAAMDALGSSLKIPQTTSGMTYLCNKLSSACETAVSTGFLAGGTWTGDDVLTLSNGDTLPNGYAILHDSIADQSSADRQARIAPTIYIPIKLAGAIHSLVIGIYVNQ